MDEPTLPLQLSWRTQLPSEGHTPFAPLLYPGAVVTRSGQAVVRVDAASGAVRWIHTLPPQSGYGEVLIRCGDLAVTERRRRPENLSSLVAVDPSGKPAWELAFDAIVGRGS